MKLFLLIQCFLFQLTISAQQSYISDRLTKIWQTPVELKTPESICYDPQQNLLFVSNIAGGPSDKDNNGFISTLSVEGKILQLEWCKGLNAPKGMGIVGDFLYVTDIDEIVKIDIHRQKIAQRFTLKGAKFLNDIAVDKEGNVFISDMTDNAIYRLKNSVPELYIKSEKLNQPNGLYVEGNNLMVGLRDRIVTINLRSKQISDYILNTGGIDGIAADGKNNYIISDWLGNIYLVNPKNERVKLLDTTPDKINTADIEYIISLKLLLVPTFSDNRIMAYEMK